MKSLLNIALIAGFLALCAPAAFAAPAAAANAEISPLTFNGVKYLHRWSQNDQNEFTPEGQGRLDRWTDMVTIIHYRSVNDGDGLAATANAVLETYKSNRAIVLRTDAVPRTKDKPAEYLIAVVFPGAEFTEAVFARFKIVEGIGTAAIYCHRKYGKEFGDQMSAWLKANGPETEKALMGWDGIPPAVASAK